MLRPAHITWQLLATLLLMFGGLGYACLSLSQSPDRPLSAKNQGESVHFVTLPAPTRAQHYHTRGRLTQEPDANQWQLELSITKALDEDWLSIDGAYLRVHSTSTEANASNVKLTVERLVPKTPKHHATSPLQRLIIHLPPPLKPKTASAGDRLPLVLAVTHRTPLTRIRYQHLRPNNTVWLIDDQQQLVIQTVQIEQQDSDTVYVSGLKGGERLITRFIAFPSRGLLLNPAEDNAAQVDYRAAQ